MKNSNRLVLLILLIFFGAIFGTSMILKQEFEKIDFDNPFYGLSRNELPAFSAVKLQGDYHGLVEIQPGEKYEILKPDSWNIFQWEVRQDTLFLHYTGEARGGRYYSEQTLSKPSAAAYVLAPSVSSVVSEGMSCRIANMSADSFHARFDGDSGGISFKDNTFKTLSAQSGDKGILQFENDNRIDKALINAEDESLVTILGQEIDSLQLLAGPQAKVLLPGALLEKIKR